MGIIDTHVAQHGSLDSMVNYTIAKLRQYGLRVTKLHRQANGRSNFSVLTCWPREYDAAPTCSVSRVSVPAAFATHKR